MDELEFRRRVYADPNTQDSEVAQAAQADPAKHQFLSDLKKLDGQIEAAMDIPVPDDLAHKLIWQQTAHRHARAKAQTKWYVALAASVAFMMGISFTLWQQASLTNMGHEAIVHVYHTQEELAHATTPVTLTQMNDKLASYGAQLVGSIGEIEVANFCVLDKIKSVHMIIKDGDREYSVFVVPKDGDYKVPSQFTDDKYHGKSIKYQNANIFVVGEKSSDLTPIYNNVKKNMIFSA